MFQCILFDRDGTLGELDDNRFPETFHSFCDIKAVFSALKEKGYTVGIITNQSSIARGTATNYDFDGEFQAYGADIWKICPHDDCDNCDCRKPKPGMLLKAAEDFNIDLSASWMIGDGENDILAGKSAGCKTALVGDGDFGQNESGTCILDILKKII